MDDQFRGYGQRIKTKKQLFEIHWKMACDKATAIRKNDWMSKIELKSIRKIINAVERLGQQAVKQNEKTTKKNEYGL